MQSSADLTPSGPHRILVVDDEPDLEQLVRQRMRREIRSGQFVMEFAHNGLEALAKLDQKDRFDIVLSDINMPQMDGLELLQRIPSVDPDVRAVVVSAYGDMKNIRTAMNRGAFDFVTKPIDFGDLRVTIDRTLENSVVWKQAMESRDQLAVLESELDVARRMQASILPTEFPREDRFEIHANMEPAQAVGGDFYDVQELPDGCLGMAIADVSGKGVPAALFMMSSRTLLKGAAIGSSDPATVLNTVNGVLSDDNAEMMFVTVLYAVYDPKTRTYTYASGGHDSPLVVHADGSATLLPHTGGVALGVMPGMEYQTHSVTLEKGDTVLLYTDGVTEAQNVDGEQFGLERLREIFRDQAPEGAETATGGVFRAVREFAGGAAQFDDITCLSLSQWS
ncbi:MAG: SpoIIE family protein phosphatase [Bryobacterales bacterium]|nr:SpoIIE family protein phosphatase [Bryobacterales bacterium]MDE0262648.1 SpoIIE family protein phosphatase [Bryobacterales bacterium]MDE0623568.1 SpoIIE family protein phosphatase [Bryobacterales bacterium]